MAAKILYNLKGISRMLTPRIFTQALLDRKIRDIFRLEARVLEQIAMRVKWYNKLDSAFKVVPVALDSRLPPKTNHKRGALVMPHFGEIGENRLTKEHSSVYYYDSYEWTRYFPDNYKWYYEFGDVNYYLRAPSITKTRPIDILDSSLDSAKLASGGGLLESKNPESKISKNSVLLQLEKNRHFSFVKDSIPYEKKWDMLFFRGACPQEHRRTFLKRYFSHPLCDIGHTGGRSENVGFSKPKVSKEAHLAYKFLLSLEGNDVASNLKWVLNSNSLCIMPRPKYESWFMESNLVPNVHYALLDDGYDNLEGVLEYFMAHPNEAKEIIHNAKAYCAQFFNPKIEAACNMLVLRKYFYLSGQGDLSKDERALLGI